MRSLLKRTNTRRIERCRPCDTTHMTIWWLMMVFAVSFPIWDNKMSSHFVLTLSDFSTKNSHWTPFKFKILGANIFTFDGGVQGLVSASRCDNHRQRCKMLTNIPKNMDANSINDILQIHRQFLLVAIGTISWEGWQLLVAYCLHKKRRATRDRKILRSTSLPTSTT